MKSSRFGSQSPVLALFAGGASANDELIKLSKDPNQWVMPTGNYANTRYSELNQINKDNAKNLRPVWTFSTGVLRGHEGGPLVIGDVMYVHTPFPNNVFALDLNKNGQILWKYEPKQDPIGHPGDVLRHGQPRRRLWRRQDHLGQADTTVVALDAKTGKPVWSVKNGDPKKGETMTNAPMVVKDKVIVGISGGEFGVPGHVTAYNLKDGSKAWRAYSIGPDDQILFDANTTELGKPVGKDSSLKTWQGDQWKIGGGDTWGWYSYDPQLNLIYYGSGNPSTWNPVQRPGDNKWSMTIFARNPDTGVAKWVFQMTPHDEWDYDGVNEMILADINVKGQPTKALVHFDRNGFAYTLNRETGALLVAEKFDPKVNWATHVDMQTGRPQVVSSTARRPRARTRIPRACARRPSARRTSNRRRSRQRPGCSMCRPTTSAWITSRSRSRILPVSPMSARLCRCFRRRATTTSAISSPGMPARARSSGPIRSRSRCGRAHSPPPATSSSMGRSKAT